MVERIRLLIESGLHDAKIAEEVGCSREYVRLVRNKLGLKKNETVYCSCMSEEQLCRVIALRIEGYPVTKIQKILRLPMSDDTIRKVLRKHGLKYKSDQRKVHSKVRWTTKRLAKFKRDYDKLLSVPKLAKKYGLSPARVSQMLNYRFRIYTHKTLATSTASEKTKRRYHGL